MNKMKQFWYKKNVLVTGGAGFIGSNLCIELVRLGAKVTVVDSLLPDYGGNLFNLKPVINKIHLNIADIRDKYSLIYLVKNKDFIFNLAGQVSHIDSMTDPVTDLEINCTSQLVLLETVRKINQQVKIIYASTRQLYGKPLFLPVSETHPNYPVDINGINMLAAEQYHMLYNDIYGIKCVSIRMTNTYGPRQLMKHSRQGFVPSFIRLALESKEICIYEPGTQKRDFNYVSDAVSALLLAGSLEKSYGKIYNLGHHKYYSLIEFTELLIKILGKGKYRIVKWPRGRKKIDIGDYYGDYSRIKRELGWEPKVSLEQGLRRTVAFYRKYKKYYW
ncbi:MAG: GDP-mannose 4,6-dehydratase [Candidatus Hydrogenedentota bacterium]